MILLKTPLPIHALHFLDADIVLSTIEPVERCGTSHDDHTVSTLFWTPVTILDQLTLYTLNYTCSPGIACDSDDADCCNCSLWKPRTNLFYTVTTLDTGDRSRDERMAPATAVVMNMVCGVCCLFYDTTMTVHITKMIHNLNWPAVDKL